MYKNSTSTISGTDSKKAKSEKKDCVVKAIASSTNVDYDTAHSWVKENFEREDKKGTSNWMISKRFKNEDMEIDELLANNPDLYKINWHRNEEFLKNQGKID